MADLRQLDVVEEDVDILIIGGGMAGCGAAYEIVPWLEAARAEGVDLTVKLVDRAAIARSGAAAGGISVLGAYVGDEADPADYARMVSNDLMGITRDDLTYDLARHVDEWSTCSRPGGCPSGRPTSTGSARMAPGACPH
jgi:adenylylsulfate reductase subunit A